MDDLNDMLKESENDTSSQTEDVTVQSNENILTLHSENTPFQLSMRFKKFENESDYNKFIKSVERMVRSSMEYKLWKSYLIDVLGMTTCVVTDENLAELSLEVHHHVPSLYIVVKGIVNETLESDEEFCSFDIATKVMETHFKNHVGYVMMISSMHEKYHNGFLDIPIELVKGNYVEFINNYSRYLDAEDLDNINNLLQTTTSNCNWTRNEYRNEVVAGGN